MQTVRVADGVEVAIEAHGAGGVPLVVVHGYTGGAHEWREVARGLAGERTVLLYDQRGHGASSAPREPSAYAMARLAEDLRGLLDARGIERAHVLGHSMGGMVALRFAVEHPARAASLVLVATTSRRRRLDAEPSTRERLIARVPGARRGLDALKRALGRGVESVPPHVAEVAYRALRVAMAEQEETHPRLHALRAPTTVIVGSEDHRFVDACRELSEAIPGARLRTIHGAAHEPMTDRPDEVIALVREHLTRAAS
jgi:pimeloyl-ACP methyl ester carboxylesterase